MLLIVFLRYVFASFCLISSMCVLVGLLAMIAICRQLSKRDAQLLQRASVKKVDTTTAVDEHAFGKEG
jgi:hypothetical protein